MSGGAAGGGGSSVNALRESGRRGSRGDLGRVLSGQSAAFEVLRFQRFDGSWKRFLFYFYVCDPMRFPFHCEQHHTRVAARHGRAEASFVEGFSL